MVTTKRHGWTIKTGDCDRLVAAIAAATGTSREQVGRVRDQMEAGTRFLPGTTTHSIAVCWSLLRALGYV